jgi:hypothetical protein
MNWRPEFCCREIGPGQIDDCPFLQYEAVMDSGWNVRGKFPNPTWPHEALMPLLPPQRANCEKTITLSL